jgi:diaminopimelate decarboxylase
MAEGFTRSFSESIGVNAAGRLQVEDVDAAQLAERFGTPLFVISESQIYTNVNRYRDAYVSRYPRSEILYATKANNNLAVRRLFTLAGAGGDAFGPGELYLTLKAGTDPNRVVLNGFNKRDEEIRMAVQAGVTIHLDAVDELDDVIRIALEVGRSARIGMRSRLLLHGLDGVESEWPPGFFVGPGAREINKFGIDLAGMEYICEQATKNPHVEFVGFHHHVGRGAADVKLHEEVVKEQMEVAAGLRDQFGWVPEYFDFGGGMAWGRPEGHGPMGMDRGSPTVEEYAEVITTTFRDGLARHSLGEPRLLVEPGRSMASDIGILLSKVGIRKTFDDDVQQTWLGVDASENVLLNILSSAFYYHPVAAEKVDAQPTETVNLGDPLCWYGNLALSAELPHVARGDIVAFLDTGAYCESKALQFNAMPRPATVLVSGSNVDVITEREVLQDVTRRFRLPARLIPEPTFTGEADPAETQTAVV